MLSLAKHYQVQTVAVLASNDNTGFDFIQFIKADAATPKYSMVVGAVYTYDVTSQSSMVSALTSIIQSGVKTVFLQVIDVGVDVLIAAYNLRMMDGSFWFIMTSGFDIFDLSFTVGLNATSSFTGIWQVEISRPFDFESDTMTPLARETGEYFPWLYGVTNKEAVGTAVNFNPNAVSLNPLKQRIPNGCNKSSQLNISSTFPNLQFDFTLNGLKVPFYVRSLQLFLIIIFRELNILLGPRR
jgi:hypothetical protein